MRKATVLFFSADPLSVPPEARHARMMLDEELREIRRKVRAAEHRDALVLDPRPAARPDDLIQALNEVRPQVVHFSGHGGLEGLVFAGGDGRSVQRVRAEAVAHLLDAFRGDVRLVFLSACFSLPQAEAAARVVGCAIGTPSSISDEAAVAFGASFYRAVAFGRSVQAAFDQARLSLELDHVCEREFPTLVTAPGVDPARIFLVADAAADPAEGDPGTVAVSASAARPGVPACKAPNAVRLFGRATLIDDVARRLRAPGDPAWAVQGLPGAGKTDLVRAVGCAPRTVAHFRGGVLYAELGQAAGAPEVLRRWCMALGVDPPPSDDAEGLAGVVRRFLADAPALLVLDDVWETTAATARMLADCRAPGCALLVSSRSPGIAAALAGSPERVHRLEMLDAAAALSLLGEHAPHAVAADPDGAPALAASLGNLPLALKLAAHLAERDDAPLPCRRLLETWRVRLAEMRGLERRPGMEEGELSLDAVISLSYDAMPEDARAAAASLSVLGAAPLDFDRAAMEVAWAAPAARATGWIDAFVASGLLERNPSTRRYSLHQTVHAFLEQRCRAWTTS